MSEQISWGYSLANVRELLTGLLDAAGAQTVLEIGAYRGELTAVLLEWAVGREGDIRAVDTIPPDELRALAAAHPELELVEKTSHEVLAEISSLPDAIVLDGDHNFHTLSQELRLIAAAAEPAPLPMLLLHDVYWPHARRDTYYAPDRIPEAERQPLARDAGLAPWDGGTVPLGLPFAWAAAREGGPRNGTVTAVEDFIAGHDQLRFARVPAFFGFGVLWDQRASWASDLASVINPLDRNPVLERLERNRVQNLVIAQMRERELEQLRARARDQERMLRRLLAASAFGWGERLSRLRHRGKPAFSREEIRHLLDPVD